MKRLYWRATLIAFVFGLSTHQAQAGFILGDASQFAVLGQFSNNQTNFNNGTINGDVGIGSPRQFTAQQRYCERQHPLFGGVEYHWPYP